MDGHFTNASRCSYQAWLRKGLECGQWQLEPSEQAKLRKVEIRANRPHNLLSTCPSSRRHFQMSSCSAQGALFGSKQLPSLSFAARLSLTYFHVFSGSSKRCLTLPTVLGLRWCNHMQVGKGRPHPLPQTLFGNKKQKHRIPAFTYGWHTRDIWEGCRNSFYCILSSFAF